MGKLRVGARYWGEKRPERSNDKNDKYNDYLTVINVCQAKEPGNRPFEGWV